MHVMPVHLSASRWWACTALHGVSAPPLVAGASTCSRDRLVQGFARPDNGAQAHAERIEYRNTIIARHRGHGELRRPTPNQTAIVETIPLDDIAAGYDRMMAYKARFRMVFTV